MNIRTITSSFLVLSILAIGLLSFSPTQASDPNSTAITGVKIVAGDDYVNISWDGLTDEDKKRNIDGYALTFSPQKSDVRIDEIAKQYLNFQTSIDLRLGTFDRNTFYYFRVFGYNRPEDRGYNNPYGSKIIKWKHDGSGNIESTIEDPTDPVITTSSTSSNSSESAKIFEFGILRATAFDSIVRFFWSDPKLTSSDFDNFVLIISEKSDLTDPVLETNIDRGLLKARIDGLKPDTQYHAAGYFEKDGTRFGKSDTISVKTYPALDKSGRERLQRRLKALGVSEGFGVIINAGEFDDDDYPTEDTSSSTSTSSSSSTSSSNTSSSSSNTRITFSSSSNYVPPNNAADINDELRRIRVEMGTLKRQWSKLILKLREIQGSQ